jgi:hypothetical protein
MSSSFVGSVAVYVERFIEIRLVQTNNITNVFFEVLETGRLSEIDRL